MRQPITIPLSKARGARRWRTKRAILLGCRRSPTRVERVEAVEPDEAMLVEARCSLSASPFPITLTCAPVESLPFPDAQFESVVATLVF